MEVEAAGFHRETMGSGVFIAAFMLNITIRAVLSRLLWQAVSAALGYCVGGTGVLELARAGVPISGVVSFHGGLDAAPGLAAEPGDVKAKVLVLHGADDPYVPAEQVAAFEKEFTAAKADWQLVFYSGAVHAFTQKEAGDDNSKGAAYNEPADRRSWAATQTVFAELFK